jgi:hypothetical protein
MELAKSENPSRKSNKEHKFNWIFHIQAIKSTFMLRTVFLQGYPPRIHYRIISQENINWVNGVIERGRNFLNANIFIRGIKHNFLTTIT